MRSADRFSSLLLIQPAASHSSRAVTGIAKEPRSQIKRAGGSSLHTERAARERRVRFVKVSVQYSCGNEIEMHIPRKAIKVEGTPHRMEPRLRVPEASAFQPQFSVQASPFFTAQSPLFNLLP
ncbi:hypothetical protein SKAU_G00091270 [Synaphobranchus kaupii]|uniref:Uncharacterized protein n=1 Tax=Synaphobranchus kaupii TaxID=118154 RepID=A0A9Q1FWF7_SYNKA|nr:hypothetical protein SKAU_G00091270 [Synaphobranchus kaupii]